VLNKKEKYINEQLFTKKIDYPIGKIAHPHPAVWEGGNWRRDRWAHCTNNCPNPYRRPSKGKYIRSWGEFPWESRKGKQQNKTNLCSFAGFFMSEPYHYVQSPMHATLQPN